MQRRIARCCGAWWMCGALLLWFSELVGFADALQLAGMAFGVVGIHLDELHQGHLTAFGVGAFAFKSLRSEAFEKLIIIGAQTPEMVERLCRLARGVVEFRRPRSLVVSPYRGVVLCDDAAKTISARIRQLTSWRSLPALGETVPTDLQGRPWLIETPKYSPRNSCSSRTWSSRACT